MVAHRQGWLGLEASRIRPEATRTHPLGQNWLNVVRRSACACAPCRYDPVQKLLRRHNEASSEGSNVCVGVENPPAVCDMCAWPPACLQVHIPYAAKKS